MEPISDIVKLLRLEKSALLIANGDYVFLQVILNSVFLLLKLLWHLLIRLCKNVLILPLEVKSLLRLWQKEASIVLFLQFKNKSLFLMIVLVKYRPAMQILLSLLPIFLSFTSFLDFIFSEIHRTVEQTSLFFIIKFSQVAVKCLSWNIFCFYLVRGWVLELVEILEDLIEIYFYHRDLSHFFLEWFRFLLKRHSLLHLHGIN